MDWATGVTVLVSVVLALGGYAATYAYNLRLAQRNDRLDRVNRQLSELYGPLLALVTSGAAAWRAFRTKYRPTSSFLQGGPPPSPEDAAAWRLWITEVFMPTNIRIVELITTKADLLEETEMPTCLLQTCAHVAAYRPVLKRWEEGDYSEHLSILNFPGEDLGRYASDSFARLKAEQDALLARAARRAG